MALSVTLKSASPAITFALQASEVRLNISRAPMHSPLPGSDPLQMDLGQFKPMIVVIGVIPQDHSELDGSVRIPDKRDLEDFVYGITYGRRGSYSASYPGEGPPQVAIAQDNITLKVTSPTPAGATQTDSYRIAIQSCNFTLQAARDNLWNYQLSMLSKGRLEDQDESEYTG